MRNRGANMKKRIVCCAIILLFLAACSSVDSTDKVAEYPSTPTANTAERNYQTESNDFLEDTSAYTDILVDYETIVSYRLSDGFVNDWNEGKYIEESESLINAKKDEMDARATHGVSLESKWSNMIIEMVDNLQNPTKEDFGYLFKDINGDAVPELFWVRKDGTILSIFTICDGEVVLLDAFFSRYNCVVTDKGELYTFAGGGVANRYDIRFLSEDAEFVGVCSFGTDWNPGKDGMEYYEIVDGQKVFVDEAQFHKILSEEPFVSGSRWSESSISPLASLVGGNT